MLCAAAYMPALAEDREKIGVEVAFGEAYADLLGTAAAAEAKTQAEESLVAALGDIIKYFDFVTTDEPATHSLNFRIAHPPSETSGQFENLHDYYVFLSLKSNGQKKGETLNWLFRDAADSLNGVDSASSIAATLNKHVIESQYEGIIRDLLNHLSFTSKAEFDSSIKGWILEHPRNSLCMQSNSTLKVHSIVPVHLYEEEFEAIVRKRPSTDGESTLSVASDDVSLLITNPGDAKVVAVRVLKYERECPAPQVITETAPLNVSFSDGGGS